MAVEIERKFLVKNQSYKIDIIPVVIRQGYLADGQNGVVRVRLFGDNAFLTIKGRTS